MCCAYPDAGRLPAYTSESTDYFRLKLPDGLAPGARISASTASGMLVSLLVPKQLPASGLLTVKMPLEANGAWCGTMGHTVVN